MNKRKLVLLLYLNNQTVGANITCVMRYRFTSLSFVVGFQLNIYRECLTDLDMSSAGGVKDFYAGKNIFITGGSGFLGICLLEKILRTIPNHGDIYLLLRPKRGKQIEERLETLKTNSVFEELLKQRDVEEVFKKVKAISGDVGVDNLGLSTEDRAFLTDRINVIIHSAATLDFGESLRDTVNVNLLGTRRITELAKECKNLQVLVHVSSAYANAYKLEVEEELYPLHKDPDELIGTVKKLCFEELERLTPQILGDHPNTYTITKHMAEHEIKKIESVVPCAIVRPSMIVGALQEPAPGWTISKNGPQGFIMGAARGVIRRIPIRKELVYDYIPVDIVVNHLLVAGFHAGSTKAKSVEVYHCTTSTRNPFCWALVEDEVNDTLREYPLMSAIWYPTLIFVPHIWLFKIAALFVHFLPAIFLDQLLKLTGGRPILMKLHMNVMASLDRLQKFIFTEWKFHARKAGELQKWLSPQDQKDYDIAFETLVWQNVFTLMVVGTRVYLNKEPLKNLEAARKKNRTLMMLHYGIQIVGYIVLWIAFSFIFNIPLHLAAGIIPLAYIGQSYI
ncbi:hypothetical protein HHI36_021218 [Cryptolaemus montrouzieri]|uniref:Fatty acyl-CoA reductase n=1 Tax=Cryptolaemus montrouzieri TaxID=559131 RepID=A0ABD2MW33_9CUCU